MKKTIRAKRNHKDTVFRMLFNDPKELLELYNGVNGSDYKDPGLLEINTLENAIYTSIKNDISFVFDCSLNLYEHQSSVNPNIPLRMLEYIADVLQKLTYKENLYGERLVRIPTPRFVVFYNGTEEQPEEIEYRLSSSFQKPTERPELELIVTVININEGKNQELMSRCKSLQEYAFLVARIRKNREIMDLESAVRQAVDECIRMDILKEFLLKNKAEVFAMSIYEYDEEAHMRAIREEGKADGIEIGMARGRAEGDHDRLLLLVRKKLAKNKSAAEIADALEEEESVILSLIEEIEDQNRAE